MAEPRTWRIAGINFDHMHMGDNLRMVHEHPHAEIVALCDETPSRMQPAANSFQIPSSKLFVDAKECIEQTRPDIVILCPATATHGEWVEKIAPLNVHLLVEKPFAASLKEADRMIAAMKQTGRTMAINWPLRWEPGIITAYRLIQEGVIGTVIEVHHYGGNRGPLWHTADKIEIDAQTVERQKPESWFYKKKHGGGSLLDYIGYGTTLGTWFHNGQVPLEVTAVVDQPANLEVDEHGIAIARYEFGLSKFETRWGTFTDPWTHQPQPKCGFVITGSAGTISVYDYEDTIRLQTMHDPAGSDIPVDKVEPPFQNPVQYLIHCLETNTEIDGPLSIDINRKSQQIIDTAVKSAAEHRTVTLLK